MYRPQQMNDRRLVDRYGALLDAQARVANTVAHTEALIFVALAAIDRARALLAAQRPADRPAARDEGA